MKSGNNTAATIPLQNANLPSLPLQLRGESLDEFISQAQDASKNAQSKSLQAAYNSWVQQLRADQVIFESDMILHLS